VGQEPTNVDVLSVQEFGVRLRQRLTEALSLADKLAVAVDATPRLGLFPQAVARQQHYAWLRAVEAGRVQRLIDAILAAQSAAGVIAGTYTNTESRNHANSDGLSAHLGNVTVSQGAAQTYVPPDIDPATNDDTLLGGSDLVGADSGHGGQGQAVPAPTTEGV
jgi:hypothetical protein